MKFLYKLWRSFYRFLRENEMETNSPKNSKKDTTLVVNSGVLNGGEDSKTIECEDLGEVKNHRSHMMCGTTVRVGKSIVTGGVFLFCPMCMLVTNNK